MDFNDDEYDPGRHPFDPKAYGLSLNNAFCLAALSQLAYSQDDKTVEAEINRWGFDHFTPFRWTGTIATQDGPVAIDTQGLICASEQAFLIVFRGTQPHNLRNWLTNAMTRTVPFPTGPGMVHRGFWTAFDAVRREIKAALGNLRNNKQAIWITGHSLGGALALVCGAHLRGKKGLPIQGIYTYGQPRVGNWAFADSVDRDLTGRVFRFVNNNDIVPQLPPIGPILKYRHAGALRYFDSDGRLHSDLPWWRGLFDMARGALQNVGNLGPDTIRDHDMAHYIHHLGRSASADRQ